MTQLSVMRTNVRDNIRDDSATSANRFWTDAQLNVHINSAMRVIQRRFYPRISQQGSAATGLSYAANAYIATTTPTNYFRILAIAQGTTFGPGMMPAFRPVQEFWDIRAGQMGATPTYLNANPSIWTCWREGTSTTASQGKWTVAIHSPSPSTIPYSALVELEQADLSADADTPDVPPEGCTMIEHLASFWCGTIMGRDYVKMFLTTYPQLQEVAGLSLANKEKDETSG